MNYKQASLLLLLTAASSFCFSLDITFAVRMSYKIEQGSFDAANDAVDIAGDFNGWGASLTPLTDPDMDSTYFVTVTGFSAQQQIEFKFRYNGVWDGNEEFSGGGGNRVHSIGNTDDTLTFWYNDEFPATGPPIAGFSTENANFYSESRTAFNNLSSGNVTSTLWSFEGGIPAATSDPEPYVYYPDSGSFDVQLIVSNGIIHDTLMVDNYINVTKRDTKELDWWNDAVFYEVFVRSFYDSDGNGKGDFKGLTQKLDYLNDGDPNTKTDLGVTALWLMPINQASSYHGYDVTNYKEVETDYGTMQDFLDFLDEAHNRGIRVILDLVINHSGVQHPWFNDSKNNVNNKRDFYRWETSNPGYNGPWGQPVWNFHNSGWYFSLFWSGMPDLNFQTPEVTDSIFSIADFWLNDIGVDGFRLDAARFLYENGQSMEDQPETIQFWKDFESHTRQIAPNSLNVAEVWTSIDKILPYIEDDGLDFCFEFDLAGAIRSAASFGNGGELAKIGEYIYNVYPHLQWGTFLTNHDMDRAFNSFNQNLDRSKVAASMYLTMPGVPFIYYGEEIGMTGSGAHENIRGPMQWNGNSKAGFTTGNPWWAINSNYVTYNVEDELADPNSLLHRYRKMIAIRNAKEAMKRGRYWSFSTNHDGVMAFMRMTHSDTALVIINSSGSSLQQIDLNVSGTGITAGSYQFWDMMTNTYETVEVDPSLNYQLSQLDAYQVMVLSPDQVMIDIPVIANIHEAASSKNSAGLSPNPGNDVVDVFVKTQSGSEFELRIYDVFGKKLAHYPAGMANLPMRVPVSGYDSGLYLFYFETNGRTIVKKFIKQ